MFGRYSKLGILIVALTAGCGEKVRNDDLDLIGAETARAPLAETKPKAPPRASTNSIGIDLVEDLVFRKLRDDWTLTEPTAHVNVDKLKAGRIGLLLSALQVAPGEKPYDALTRDIAVNRELVAGTGGAMEVVSSFKSAKRAFDRGVIAVGLLLEGADALAERIDQIAELKKQGLMVVGVVSARDNVFAGSSGGVSESLGLTDKGRELLEACRDSKIAVDVTHASNRAFWDILIELSGAAMASHTAARALRDHPRNLDDLQIIALSRWGGLIGLVFNPDFLKPGVDTKASLNDVVDHIMHMKELGALGALALGTDFGGINPPDGLEDVSKLPGLARALEQQGLSDSQIDGIFGGNAARFFEDIERERGEVRLTQNEILRPIPTECDSVIGDFEGAATPACNGYLLDSGPQLKPASRQKIRIKEMALEPVRLELFGAPGTPWQVEGQNLEGKVLFNRIVALDDDGRGALLLPSGRNLARLFLTPTRPSALREAVVWGR